MNNGKNILIGIGITAGGTLLAALVIHLVRQYQAKQKAKADAAATVKETEDALSAERTD